MKNLSRYFFCLSIALLFNVMFSCGSSGKGIDHGESIDTLRVVTLYGPTSFFNYRGELMGIDYDNIRRFAEDEGMVMEIHTARNINDMISELKDGKAHLAAYPVPSIAEYNEEVIHCGPKDVSWQVLVQKKGDSIISDVTQLVGKNVAVEKDSKFQYRLENLNEELGGGINIEPITADTITSVDILRMVNDGNLKLAVVDSDIAALYSSAFPGLDTSLRLSSDQAASWVVAKGLDSLANKIDTWENRTHSSEFIKDIYKRYYDRTLSEDLDFNLSYFKNRKEKGDKNVSAYDEIFKRYSSISGYDWHLLAAIAYCESRYNPSVESRFGALGLMQVMPATAKAVGVDPSSLVNPDNNVKAAARIIKKLDDTLKSKVEDPEERMKFIVAAYNSGLGHIYDSMALAEKLGLDPQRWVGNVSIAALMKSRPEYYTDPVVKHGYFRGRETVEFVDHVTSIFNYLN